MTIRTLLNGFSRTQKWSDSEQRRPSGFQSGLSDLRRQTQVLFGALERVGGVLTVSIELLGLTIFAPYVLSGSGQRSYRRRVTPRGRPVSLWSAKGCS
jgi:hypothetical protein